MAPDFDIPILLVDDDAMVRGVLMDYLTSFGFTRIIDTRDPQKALKYIQDPAIAIGLVLSDWEMPGLTGMTLLKALRNCKFRQTTRFIMITSQQSMERFKVAQAAQWSVNSYLVKPFRAEALRDRIWKVMGWKDEPSSAAS
jgi:two-component system, chemotaxis family, chemotaxis protein CheY